MTEHEPLSCKLENMELTKESRCGLQSCLHFRCNVCGVEKNIFTEDPCDKSRMEINSSAVSGVLSVGGGLDHLEEITAAMNMPCMSSRTYSKYHNIICDGLFATSMEEIKMAAQEESRLAIQEGAVDVDDVPLITVVADGSWAKRFYHSNFSSLSGVALKEEKKPQKHTCFKNWGEDQSSSSMDAAIIVNAFCKSEEIYGLR